MRVNLKKELRRVVALGTAALMSISGCFTLPSTSLVAYAAPDGSIILGGGGTGNGTTDANQTPILDSQLYKVDFGETTLLEIGYNLGEQGLDVVALVLNDRLLGHKDYTVNGNTITTNLNPNDFPNDTTYPIIVAFELEGQDEVYEVEAELEIINSILSSTPPSFSDIPLEYTKGSDETAFITYTAGTGIYADSNHLTIYCPEELSSNDFSVNENTITLSNDFLDGLTPGVKNVLVLFTKDGQSNVGLGQATFQLDIKEEVVENEAPSLTDKAVSYNGNSPADVDIRYSTGKGELGVAGNTGYQGLEALLINGQELERDVDNTWTNGWYSSDGYKITLRNDYLSTLRNGSYNVTVVFANGHEDTATLTVENSKVVNPTVTPINDRFDGNNPWDLVFWYTLNPEGNKVSSIVVHNTDATTKTLTEHKDYSLVYNEGIQRNEIQILTGYLKQLTNGSYTMDVHFTNGYICENIPFTVENYKEGTAPTVEQGPFTYDASTTDSVKPKITFGYGSKGATRVVSVTDSQGNMVADWYYSNMDVVLPYFTLRKLDNGNYTFNVTFDDYANTTIPVTVRVISSSPSLDSDLYEVDFSYTTTVDIGYSSGSGANKGLSITGVVVGGWPLYSRDYNVESDSIRLWLDPGRLYDDGYYDVVVSFNTASGTKTASTKLKVSNSVTSSNEPELSGNRIEYTQGSENVASIGYNPGTGVYARSEVYSIRTSDSQYLSSNDYSVNTATRKITFSKEFLEGKAPGDYFLTVSFEGTELWQRATDTFTLSIREQSIEPSLDKMQYEFNGRNPQPLEIGFSLGSGDDKAGRVRRVIIYGAPVSDYDITYNFDTNTGVIKVPVAFFENLGEGNYTLLVDFVRDKDGDITTNTATVEVINSFVDALPPKLLTDNIAYYTNSNLEVRYRLGIGALGVDESQGWKGISQVLIDNNPLDHAGFSGWFTVETDDGTPLLCFASKAFIGITQGEHILKVVFANGEEDTATLNVYTSTTPKLTDVDYTYTKGEDSSLDIAYEPGTGIYESGFILQEVKVGSGVVDNLYWDIDETEHKIVLSKVYLDNLADANYSLAAVFNKGTFETSSATRLEIKSNTAPDTTPPALWDNDGNFEYDQLNPSSSLEIPVKFNSATEVTKVTVDGKEIDFDSEYTTATNLVALFGSYLDTLESGAEYEVIITFNDKASTEITVYVMVYAEDKDIDDECPALVRKAIVFTGNDITLNFTPGAGDAVADGILALILGDKIILPNGKLIPFNESNVANIRDIIEDELDDDYIIDEEEPDVDKDPEIATPSDAEPATPSNASPSITSGTTSRKQPKRNTALDKLKALFQSDSESVTIFTVNGNTITISGEFISNLNLEPGTYELGVIFDNDSLTVDDSSVRLIIEDETELPEPGDGDGEDNPPYKPEDPDDGKPDEGDGDKDQKPSRGDDDDDDNSGNDYSRSANSQLNADGSQNPNYKLSVPNTGGTWTNTADGTWQYIKPNGDTASDEWVGDGKNWYFLNRNGAIVSGWQLISNKWYYFNPEHNGSFGAMVTGWYFDKADGHWYYLSAVDGSLVTGWQYINSHWYYFHINNGESTYVGNDTEGWKFISTEAKPHGSMYVDETTPDGYKVNKDGTWTK